MVTVLSFCGSGNEKEFLSRASPTSHWPLVLILVRPDNLIMAEFSDGFARAARRGCRRGFFIDDKIL
jgi:hypothetical protein